MKLSVNLDLTGPIERLRGYVSDVESAGADVIWVAEAYARDATCLLGYCAAVSERVRFGTAILNVYSRTPTLLAQFAATMDELTGGRFEFGLGSSGPQVIEGWHGMPFHAPLRRTAEVIDVCRQVWRREAPLEIAGETITIPYAGPDATGQGRALKIITHPVRPAIPIWVGALGPRNVEQTAERADGWLPMLFVPERFDQVWGDALRAGTTRRHPSLGPLRISASAHVKVTSDAPAEIAAARDLARPSLARYIGGMGSRTTNFYNRLARRYGFGADADTAQELYLSRRPAEAAAALSDELVERMTVCGPPSYVRERLAAYAAAGVTDFRINVNAGSDGPRAIEQLRELMP